MTAQLLREAALFMRERAEFAPDSPWSADLRPDGRCWIDVPDEDGHAWSMHGFPAGAVHIASWHPAVALAVALLLDNEANAMDSADQGHTEQGYNNARRQLLVDIAQKYLGRDS